VSVSGIKDVLKLRDIKAIKKEIFNSIKMIIFFGGMLLAMNYAKTYSITMLTSIICVILGVIFYGIITIVQINKDMRVFFLFESVSLFITSNIFLAIGLTSYYAYLGSNNVLFGCILFFTNFFVAFLAYKAFRKIILKNLQVNKGKLVSVSIISISSIGYILGLFLSKQMGQVDIHITIIVLTYIVSCVILIASAINLFRYRLVFKTDVK